jgi:AcrR family transcriptional regulator
MAYEVTKLVHGRPYRYSVRSERDGTTGRFRNRWTYLGRADATAVSAPRVARPNAREALLDALERLLDRTNVDTVTAAAIATEAGLAHGTFYRYFRNKNDAFRAAFERLRTRKPPDLWFPAAAPPTKAEARAALRAWGAGLFWAPERARGLFRAWRDLAEHDPDFARERHEGREAYVRRLAAYFTQLVDGGFAQLNDTEGTARALFAMLDGLFRETLARDDTLGDARINAALDLIERGVFGSL